MRNFSTRRNPQCWYKTEDMDVSEKGKNSFKIFNESSNRFSQATP